MVAPVWIRSVAISPHREGEFPPSMYRNKIGYTGPKALQNDVEFKEPGSVFYNWGSGRPRDSDENVKRIAGPLSAVHVKSRRTAAHGMKMPTAFHNTSAVTKMLVSVCLRVSRWLGNPKGIRSDNAWETGRRQQIVHSKYQGRRTPTCYSNYLDMRSPDITPWFFPKPLHRTRVADTNDLKGVDAAANMDGAWTSCYKWRPCWERVMFRTIFDESFSRRWMLKQWVYVFLFTSKVVMIIYKHPVLRMPWWRGKSFFHFSVLCCSVSF